MSEHHLVDEKLHAEAAAAQQAAFTHSMSATPAALVNGFSLGTVGRMVRVTFSEGVVPQLPPHVRAAVSMHPEDLAQLVAGAQQLLGKMQEAGLWAPPAAAPANGAGQEEHVTH